MACMTRDHPRRCGTFIEDQTDVFFDLGSSPQMRGTCCGNRFYRFFSRIIPAGTGHFTWLAAELHALRDHPRRCGAFINGFTHSRPLFGSSPQVRGISSFALMFVISVGIIPAGAGHLQCLTQCVTLTLGSSPQVRGILTRTGSTRKA